MPGKTQKKQGKRSPELTALNKKRQAAARLRKATKRKGLAAEKRLKKREWLRKMRKDNPDFGHLPKPEPKIEHLPTDREGGVIYSANLKMIP